MSGTNALKEAVERDPDLDWEQDFVQKARGNAFYQRVLREGLFSDMSQALGAVQDKVVAAAKRMAVGRDIIWMVPTDQPLTRFYLAKRGAVSRVGETKGLEIGERFTKTDIQLTYEYIYDAAFTRSYIEDVPFFVLERAPADGGQLLEEQLTKDIMALYEGVAAGNLAGGAEISATNAGTLAWADIVKARQVVRREGFNPDVCIVHPDQIADLWSDDKFIHGFYFGEKVDVERGLLGSTYLGLRIVETDLATAAKCHVLDSRVAAACLVRRDIMAQPYEVPNELREGVMVSVRYGLGTLRTTAIARVTGC
jgi:hypothetical protein